MHFKKWVKSAGYSAHVKFEILTYLKLHYLKLPYNKTHLSIVYHQTHNRYMSSTFCARPGRVVACKSWLRVWRLLSEVCKLTFCKALFKAICTCLLVWSPAGCCGPSDLMVCQRCLHSGWQADLLQRRWGIKIHLLYIQVLMKILNWRNRSL